MKELDSSLDPGPSRDILSGDPKPQPCGPFEGAELCFFSKLPKAPPVVRLLLLLHDV